MKKLSFLSKLNSRPAFLHVPIKEKILFAQNLAVMIKSGVSLLDSLRLIQSQTKSKSFKYIIGSILIDIDNGQFLSVSMEKYKTIFDDIFINVIRVGEASGTLSENLKFIAHELGKKQALKKKVKAAMIYPTVIVIATIGVAWLLTGFVLPKILPILTEIDVELPITTRILIAVTNFIAGHNALILISVAVLFVGGRLLLRLRPVRFIYHKSLVYIPIVKSFVVKVNIAYFTRTLSILLKSGIKIVQAIQVTAASLSNIAYQRELSSIAESLSQGGTIAAHLKRNEAFFPPTLSRLIEVGETTGNLDENLQYLSEFYEEEVNEMTGNLTSIIEPVVLIAMGGMVGFVAISIITPLFQLSTGGL